MDPAVLRAAFERLTKVHGLSPQVATGILGQLTAESGGGLDPSAYNPNDPGGSRGIAQWNRERLAAMQRYRSPYGASDERDRQIDFLVSELNTTHKGVLNRMLAAQNPREMTRAALGFEAPGGYTRDNPEGAHSFGKRLAATESIVPGILGTASPVTGTGAASPVTAAAVQRAANIEQFRQMMSARFPELQYTSGYRSPSANKAAGGAKGSQHMHNLAVDARLKNFDDAKRAEIYNYARSIGAQGIGYYPGSQSAHFDLRKGAPAAWGGNYSRTSLPGTPKWYQDIAQQHLSGAPTTALASSGAIGGAPGGAGVGDGQPAQSASAPATAQPPDLLQQGLQNIATALTGPPVEAAAPMQAPEPTSPMSSAPVGGPDQNGAANMMAALLDRKRSAYTPQQPGIFQTGVFA